MNYPQRIICLTEETTELLYLLGEQERIVGITGYTVRPINAKKEKPIVSSFISGNIKKIKELKPDLILGFSDIQAELASILIKEGLNVYISNQRTLEEIFSNIYFLGNLVDKKEATIKLIDEWKKTIENFHEKTKSYLVKPRVFFQEWNEPVITAIQWVHELIEICGGDNIYANLSTQSMAKERIVSIDDIVSKNPEVIIGSWCGKPMDKEWIYHYLSNTDAVRKNKIVEIDSSIILQPGPALFIEGIQKIFSAIHSVTPIYL